MKNYRNVIAIITGSLLFFIFYSCESTNSGTGSSDIVSVFNSNASHRAGENCMNCHDSNGSGDGVFSVAGTVYNESLSSPLPNSTVRIYSSMDENADPLYVIEVDAKGNFYTTENISFGDGLYTSVQGSNAEIFMESAITNGSCNSCHGVTTDRIRVE